MSVIAAETPATPGSQAKSRSDRNLQILLLICGLILRFGFVLWKKTYVRAPGSILPFGAEICSIAEHIVRGQGFSAPFVQDTGPTAWIAPVYPYLAALVFRLFGIYSVASAIVLLGIQCIIAAATGITIHALGRRTFGAQVGFCAAWIWALIALTNPALLSVMPFTFLYAAFVNHRSFKPWFASAALAGVLFAALVSPWLIRNEVVFGRPVFFRSNFWFEFHLGNYHFSNGMGFSGKHPAANPRIFKEYASMGEMGFLDYYKADSLRFVREYPSEFLDLTLHRSWWFWDGTSLLYQSREWWRPWEFWPLSLGGWLGLLFVLTRRPRGWLLFASALLVYPVPYYFVYPVSKYRHAIEPELLLLSVYFVFVLWSEIRLSITHKF